MGLNSLKILSNNLEWDNSDAIIDESLLLIKKDMVNILNIIKALILILKPVNGIISICSIFTFYNQLAWNICKQTATPFLLAH